MFALFLYKLSINTGFAPKVPKILLRSLEVPHKYNVEIKQIDDVEKYLNNLL